MYYVYILTCHDDKTYIGCTNDLRDRINRHQHGQVSATKSRLPVKLYSYFAFGNEHQAFVFEQYLKTGNGRSFLNKHIFQNKVK